ncbi:MAG: hypothetical protein OHK0046_21650 [Anaerolineae bacterium]
MNRLFKEIMILGLAFVALVYLMFPSLGIFELAPDFLPLVGWIDEGVATAILLNTARYYGLDLTSLYGRSNQPKATRRRDEDEPMIITQEKRDQHHR